MENVTSMDDWVEMAQWSDVIIFDLLLANRDRLKHFPVRNPDTFFCLECDLHDHRQNAGRNGHLLSAACAGRQRSRRRCCLARRQCRYGLNRHKPFYMRMRVIIEEFKILILPAKQIALVRIKDHLRQGARITAELQVSLL